MGRKKTGKVYGVGINDADYVQQIRETVGYLPNGNLKQILVWMCPFYQKWVHMLVRCYSARYQKNKPTYIGCYVCDDWLYFSKFKLWMEQQDWEGKQLDKDLLVLGNKVYSPETCCFISGGLNSFMTESDSARGDWPIGVSFHKRDQKFTAKCLDPFTNKAKSLGYFLCPLLAHKAWLEYKLSMAYKLAELETDPRISDALIYRYENYPIQNITGAAA